MQYVELGETAITTSALGFGCAAVMGRAGRRQSLAALTAAYDAGITFYDTARSYGYGESEALLGEFFRGRRDSVILSSKFGILPARAGRFKQLLKPVARTLLNASPRTRRFMQRQIAGQFSVGHFTVEAMRSSLDTSLRQLQTGYVDFLFLHLPPVSVFQQDDLFAALEQLSVDGKVLRYGVAADPPVAFAALDAAIPYLRSIQAPCNVFDLSLANGLGHYGNDLVAIANHPFGGPQLESLADDATLPPTLQEKFRTVDDAALADLILNLITTGTGIQMVVPSMLQLNHLRANIAAMERSRFTAEELSAIRRALVSATPALS
jgi:aryl-alcohol dehydrogenase-like predicted oxidoreductase